MGIERHHILYIPVLDESRLKWSDISTGVIVTS